MTAINNCASQIICTIASFCDDKTLAKFSSTSKRIQNCTTQLWNDRLTRLDRPRYYKNKPESSRVAYSILMDIQKALGSFSDSFKINGKTISAIQRTKEYDFQITRFFAHIDYYYFMAAPPCFIFNEKIHFGPKDRSRGYPEWPFDWPIHCAIIEHQKSKVKGVSFSFYLEDREAHISSVINGYSAPEEIALTIVACVAEVALGCFVNLAL